MGPAFVVLYNKIIVFVQVGEPCNHGREKVRLLKTAEKRQLVRFFTGEAYRRLIQC
jgi:hypothetical protein